MRRTVEFLLYTLIAGLPFEYYFRTPEQSLYSTLKLQVVLFMAAWAILKLLAASRDGVRVWQECANPTSRRLLCALLIFVLSQVVAAAFAAEARSNAANAAAKTAAGALLFFAASDLFKEGKLPRALLAALSLSGLCVALIGFGDFAGIAVFRNAIALFQYQRFRLTDRLRFQSTMEYPTIAGHFLSASLFASLALILRTKPEKGTPPRPSLWMSGAAFQSAALSLTYSRGSVGAAILGLALASRVFRRSFPGLIWKGTVAACLALLAAGIVNQLYVHYATGGGPILREARTARFGLAGDDEIKYVFPGREYSEKMVVRNESRKIWTRGNFGVGYRWQVLGGTESTDLKSGALFMEDLLPGQDREIEVMMRTPPVEGEYLLIWWVYERDLRITVLQRSFSPAIVCKVGFLADQTTTGLSDKARHVVKLIRDERLGLKIRDVPGRMALWTAALRTFYSRPWLGIGPDNFRLLKWKYMEIPGGDERILANSLYFETLSGSGLIGLVSLLWLLIEIGRGIAIRYRLAVTPEEQAAAYFGIAYFTAFVTHGLVDYFLKFTPTFLLFWIMMGALAPARAAVASTKTDGMV